MKTYPYRDAGSAFEGPRLSSVKSGPRNPHERMQNQGLTSLYPYRDAGSAGSCMGLLHQTYARTHARAPARAHGPGSKVPGNSLHSLHPRQWGASCTSFGPLSTTSEPTSKVLGNSRRAVELNHKSLLASPGRPWCGPWGAFHLAPSSAPSSPARDHGTGSRTRARWPSLLVLGFGRERRQGARERERGARGACCRGGGIWGVPSPLKGAPFLSIFDFSIGNQNRFDQTSGRFDARCVRFDGHSPKSFGSPLPFGGA